MTCTETPKTNPQGIIILGVNIHCEGCANEVRKHLRGYEGVEGIEINGQNKVSVLGKNADPIKVSERLRKKSGKHVELISPKPQPRKQEKKELEIKKPQAEVIEVVLKIYLHCESCAKEVKHCILKMQGVETVDADMEKNLVRVKGSMQPQKLVELMMKRGGRHAEIVKQRHAQVVKQSHKGDTDQKKHGGCHPDCEKRLLYAPQLFSDDNPNSCSLM